MYDTWHRSLALWWGLVLGESLYHHCVLQLCILHRLTLVGKLFGWKGGLEDKRSGVGSGTGVSEVAGETYAVTNCLRSPTVCVRLTLATSLASAMSLRWLTWCHRPGALEYL